MHTALHPRPISLPISRDQEPYDEIAPQCRAHLSTRVSIFRETLLQVAFETMPFTHLGTLRLCNFRTLFG